MVDDSRGSADDNLNAGQFEAWVQRVAEERGLSEQEVVDQMMSSYWILDELSGMIRDPGSADGGQPRFNQDTHDEPEPTIADGDSTENAEILESIRELKSIIESAQTEPVSSSESSSAEQPQQETQGGSLHESSQSKSQQTDSGYINRENKIKELEEQINNIFLLLKSIDRDIDQTNEQMEAIEEDVDDLLEWFEELTDRTADIEEDVEAKATADEVSELSSRLNRITDDLKQRQEEIHAQMQTELENLSEILEHLVSRDDELEAQLSAIAERSQASIRTLHTFKQERERLTSLKNDAIEHGITSASCDYCGVEIQMDILSQPRCPQCEREITEVSTKEGWLRGQDTLVTEVSVPEPEVPEINIFDDESEEPDVEPEPEDKTDESDVFLEFSEEEG